MHILLTSSYLLHIFARAGGGGSGGGSGGGGGGSIVIAIGYLPTHFVTRLCMQHASRRTSIIIGSIVGAIVTLPFAFLNFFIMLGVGIGAVCGVQSGLKDWLGKLKNRVTGGKQKLALAASKDPAWQEQAIDKRVSQVFYDYQKDWSKFKVAPMESYLEQRYYQHVQLMMMALYEMGRTNIVDNPQLLSAQPIAVNDYADNDTDALGVLIKAKANDQLLDFRNNQIIYTDTSKFEEIWWFDRRDDTWDLMRIDQATAEGSLRDVTLERFAESHGMFYSLDWGWLLLPLRGRLFSKASFKGSNVNNHVIGKWGEQIVQMYTYAPSRNAAEMYLVAQLTLPKSYGGILIRRKQAGWLQRSLFQYVPSYRRISMEWPDFNKRYEVWATDADKVTSFELLNPKFMANLYDKQLPFNIEVVDNVIYMYASLLNLGVAGSRQRYEETLGVLQAAYKELYM